MIRKSYSTVIEGRLGRRVWLRTTIATILAAGHWSAAFCQESLSEARGEPPGGNERQAPVRNKLRVKKRDPLVVPDGFSTQVVPELDSIAPYQPLYFACEFRNATDKGMVFPKPPWGLRFHLIFSDSDSDFPFIGDFIAKSGHWDDTPLGGSLIPPRDCLAMEHVVVDRRGPNHRQKGNVLDWVFPTPGEFKVCFAAYDYPDDPWQAGPAYQGQATTIRVREPDKGERRGGDIMTLPGAGVPLQSVDRKANQLVIERCRQFLADFPESPMVDDIRLLLSRHLWVAASRGVFNAQEVYDPDLQAESLKHRYAVSPQRQMLYRAVMRAPSFEYLLMPEIRARLDVESMLKKVTDSPPFPNTPTWQLLRRRFEHSLQQTWEALG